MQVVIVGAGLVGSLLSLYLARLGYEVTVYERSPDVRRVRRSSYRSINLTLCERGLSALERVGMRQAVLAVSVAARGRVMHSASGELAYQPYGNAGEAIYSISRNGLNEVLLEAAQAEPGVRLCFEHECTGVDFATGELSILDQRAGRVFERRAERIVAADGAFSPLRGLALRQKRFDYSQEYSSQAYKELHMPPRADGDFALEPHALHIWPRGDYMLIAFPNADRSFTCSLHLPWEGGPPSHAALREDADVQRLFESAFPDALALMPDVVRDVRRNPLSAMATIRCEPWTLGPHVLLIGDAAHAILPSYGQGANSGFEDCLLLAEALTRHGHDWPAATADFQSRRKPEADAIARLCQEHFVELRALVGEPRFLLRKQLERRLNELYPRRFLDLYSMISFTRMSYVEALQVEERQRRLVDGLLAADGFERRFRAGDGDALLHAAMQTAEVAP